MRFHSYTRRRSCHDGEDGYIFLTLILIVALMAIVALATVPTMKFNMRRDREEEMIHRGVQYSNAIRRYYKKFGRYPTKIEDLESSNNLRFLRKRYKDPMNCKAGKCQDFKLLYFSDVQQMLTGFGGGGIAGATPASAMNGQNNSSAFGQSSSFGQTSSFGQSSTFGQSSAFGGNNSFGSTSSSLFGQNQQPAQTQPQTGNQPGSDSSQQTSQDSSGSETQNGSGTSSSSSTSGQPGSGQIIGGPIVGVASATKVDDNTIREFNHKKKYKDWMFIYDPMQDQGRLITTPYQPAMQGLGQAPNVNGQNGTNGSSNGFGSSTLGNSPSGLQNSPAPTTGGFGNSNQPSNSPPSNSPQ
jgi:type II secretory pathway pseudopilin PulG